MRRTMRQLVKQIESRELYFGARAVVLLIFGSILFFPKELELALETPMLLGVMLLGTIIMALVLLGDLLTARQKSVGSLMYKYVFLTMSVILAYGLFYYVNSTLLEPPGLYFRDGAETALEQAVFYFSGVTYFTIGYGDITPIGVNAQAAAITEAFAGTIINLIVLATAIQKWAWKSKR